MTKPLRPDGELRKRLEQEFADLDTAIEIASEAAKVDEPLLDGDMLSAVLATDVLTLIRDKMAAGLISESVIYFLARHSKHELEEHRRHLHKQTSQHMSKIAQRSRSRRWAHELAACLVKNHDSFHEAWRSIPKDDSSECDPTRYAGYEVWREGEELRASKSGRDEGIRRESFRTGYFVPARKAGRRNL